MNVVYSIEQKKFKKYINFPNCHPIFISIFTRHIIKEEKQKEKKTFTVLIGNNFDKRRKLNQIKLELQEQSEFGELECVHKFFPSSSLSHLVLHKVMFNFQSKINQSMKLLLKYFLFYKTHQPKPTTLGSLYNFHLQIYLTIIEWN